MAKLVEHHQAGDVPAALALLPASTGSEWFKQLFDYPLCFITGHLRLGTSEHSTLYPAVVVYLGGEVSLFNAEFGDIGAVVAPK